MNKYIPALLFLMAIHSTVRAASPVTESFDTGLNGWTNTGSITNWIATGGVARASFAARSYPSLHTAILSSPAGGFTGDLLNDGSVELLGFDFTCENVKPSELSVDIVSASGKYRVYLTSRVGEAGTTTRMVVPLYQRTGAPWVLGMPDEQEFNKALASVQRIDIRVIPARLSAQAYRVDNVFLDGRPASSSLRMDAETGGPALVWQSVRPDSVYRLEASDDLSAPGGGWRDAGEAAASPDGTLEIPVGEQTDQPAGFYRLKMK